MEKKTLAIIALMLCTISGALAQENKKKVVDANALYSDSAFVEASKLYNAVEANSEYKGQANYNAANALYRADSLEKAIEILQSQAQLFSDNTDKAKSYHNLGNAQLKAGKLEEAVKAYKEALKNNPSDEETRYNYTKAKKMLEQQQQQQKQDKPEDKKDEKKQDKKEEQKQQDQQQEEEKKQEEDQQKEEQSQEQQEQNQQQQQQKQQQAAASKKQAEQMLNALNQEEKGIQKKVKKQKGKGTKIKIEKDW